MILAANMYIWMIAVVQICIFVHSRANMHIWPPNIHIWLQVDQYQYVSVKYRYLVSEYICAYIYNASCGYTLNKQNYLSFATNRISLYNMNCKVDSIIRSVTIITPGVLHSCVSTKRNSLFLPQEPIMDGVKQIRCEMEK